MIQPSPVPSPLPVIVTDTVRDAVDWWSFGVSIGAAVVGLLFSGVAVVLARKANRVAVEAKQGSADAEIRAIGRATRERRILFELEILRDLVEAVSNADSLKHQVNHPYVFRQVYGGALRFFPSDLPTWQGIVGTERQRDLYKIFPAPQETIDGYDKDAKMGGWVSMALPAGITVERVQEALLSDIKAAIDARMKPVDLQAE